MTLARSGDRSGLVPVVLTRITPNDDVYLLVDWLAQEGDEVFAGEAILAVESSKAIEDVEAPVSGVLTDRVPVGREYSVGETLAYITPTKASKT